MSVKRKLTPYIRRFYQAYLFKIGLVSLTVVLMAMSMVSLVSKFRTVTDMTMYQVVLSISLLTVLWTWAWIKRPRRKVLHRAIDALGFDNRVVTYFEYKDSDNPFTDYLETDLLECLQTDKHKTISRRPQGRFLAGFLVSAVLLVGLNLWQTDVSRQGEALVEDIEQIEDKAVALKEALENEIEDLEELELAEKEMEQSLEAIKDNLREENRSLAEQNLFKMEESLDRRLTGEGLPEAVEGIMEGIKEVALETDSPMLLASLAGDSDFGQVDLNNMALTEGAATENPKAENISGDSNPSSNQAGQQGDGT